MADHVGVHRTLVDAVCRGDKPIPDRWCPVVERITTGGIQAHLLRPDLRWVRVPSTNWPHPEGKPLVDVDPPIVPVAMHAAACFREPAYSPAGGVR